MKDERRCLRHVFGRLDQGQGGRTQFPISHEAKPILWVAPSGAGLFIFQEMLPGFHKACVRLCKKGVSSSKRETTFERSEKRRTDLIHSGSGCVRGCFLSRLFHSP